MYGFMIYLRVQSISIKFKYRTIFLSFSYLNRRTLRIVKLKTKSIVILIIIIWIAVV